MRKILFYIILLLPIGVSAQNADTLGSQKPKAGSFILPITLVGVGVIGLESDWLKYQNKEIRDEMHEDIDRRITIDDFSQYAPMVAVYGLNVCGVKGKNNFKTRTVRLATAYLIMGVTVNTFKHTTSVERPDGTSMNSFPSGHTATAFMGAEFLWQEYKDVSPWIGVAGYTVAAGTGFFRMYNNRHWLTDVITGAGIGMLSTKIAYWVCPMIENRRKKNRLQVVTMPYVTGRQMGMSCCISF